MPNNVGPVQLEEEIDTCSSSDESELSDIDSPCDNTFGDLLSDICTPNLSLPLYSTFSDDDDENDDIALD